ncbi:hypothetical protein J3A83DRAFT_4196234 [Scleroderma citrinum]
MPTANDFIIPTGSKFTVAQHEVACLWHHPLIFQDIVILVVQLQCTLLVTYAMLNSARGRASAGPSRVSHPQLSAGGEEKWEELDLAEILKPHSYHFSKPTILASVLTSARKKTYLFNWLSTCSLWISQVNVHQPTKFLFPQMWRDFLNTIDTNQPNQPASTKSALRTLAVWDILGDHIIQLAQGLAEAPEEVMWQEMQIRAIIPHLWTSSDKAQIAHQILLYNIFSGVSGVVMWLEPLPQDGHKLGLCAVDMSPALSFLNNFHELLSAWPGAPPHLQLPAKLDGRENMALFTFKLAFVLICTWCFQECTRWQSATQSFGGGMMLCLLSIKFRLKSPSASTAQSPNAVSGFSSSLSNDQVSHYMPSPSGPSTRSASTSQLPNTPLNVPLSLSDNQALLHIPYPSSMTQPLSLPPAFTCQCNPPGTKSLYLSAPPPVFVLLGCQCLAQGACTISHQPQHTPPTCKPDVFDIVNEIQFNGEKQQNQWQQWSQNIILALVKPCLWYPEALQSLCVTCHVDQLENDLVNNHVNDIIDYNLQLAAAKASLSKATPVLKQKKTTLGMSAHTNLHLLRNNK